MQTTIARARTCMLNAQQRQKPYYDRKHVPSVFDVAADVLLATTNLHLRTTGTRKLIPRWVEPFKVLARMGSTAYCLDLPDCMHQVHNVFHVSLIKPYRSDGRTQLPPPPELVDDCPPGQYKCCQHGAFLMFGLLLSHGLHPSTHYVASAVPTIVRWHVCKHAHTPDTAWPLQRLVS